MADPVDEKVRLLVNKRNIKSFGYRRTGKTNIEDIGPDDGNELNYFCKVSRRVRPLPDSLRDERGTEYYLQERGVLTEPTHTTENYNLETCSITAFNLAFKGMGAILRPPMNPNTLFSSGRFSSQIRHYVTPPVSEVATHYRAFPDVVPILSAPSSTDNSGCSPSPSCIVNENKRRISEVNPESAHVAPTADPSSSGIPSTRRSLRVKQREERENSSSVSLVRAPSSGLKNSTPSQKVMEKEEFNRCLGVLSQWHKKIAIVNAQQMQNTEDTPAEVAPTGSTVFESNGHLDVKFSLGQVSSFLTCYLCKGLFHNAHTIRDCMHTFCKSCLVMYTVEYGMYCPKCYMPLPLDGMEGVGHDRNLQSLVDKLFPDFQRREEETKDQISVLRGISVDFSKDTSLNNSDEPSARPHEAQSPEKEQTINSMGLAFRHRIMYYDYIRCNLRLTRNSDPETVTLIAMLHNEDAPKMNTNQFNVEEYLGEHMETCNGKTLCKRPANRADAKLRGMYVAVPNHAQVSELRSLLSSTYGIPSTSRIELTIGGKAMHQNHTVYFMCRMMKIDTSQCVLVRFRVIEAGGSVSRKKRKTV